MNLNLPNLALPRNFVKKRKAIIQWFRLLDEKLVNLVTAGDLRVLIAQTYFKWKVEDNPDLSKADKQKLADESKIWKMPT